MAINEHHSKSRTEQQGGGGASKAPTTDSIPSSAFTGFYHTPLQSVSATHHRIHNAYRTLSHHGIFSIFTVTCSQKKKKPLSRNHVLNCFYHSFCYN